MPRAAASALALFSLAGMTDLFDGLLARWRGERTALGKLLDPLVDRIVSLSVLIALLTLPAFPDWLAVVVMLILSKEIAVSALFGIAASVGYAITRNRGETVLAVLQFAALWGLLASRVFTHDYLRIASLAVLVVLTVFHLKTLVEYAVQFGKIRTEDLKGL